MQAKTKMSKRSTDAVVPVPAATIVLVRERKKELQVLLLKRSATSRFMGGNYVFPGGRVETADDNLQLWQAHLDCAAEEIAARIGEDAAGDQMLATAVAAIRETFEETGVLLAHGHQSRADALGTIRSERLSGRLPPDWLQRLTVRKGWIIELSRLFRWSRWITPEQMRHRYDTWFFLARMPQDQVCLPDMRETVHHLWISPGDALRKNLSGKVPLSPPTLLTLHEMLPYARLQSILKDAAGRSWGNPLKPRLISDGGEKIILEPWDPDYHRSQVRLKDLVSGLQVAPVGASFSKLWYSEGVWKPLTS